MPDDYIIHDGYKIKRCCEHLESIINDADAAWVSDDGKLCIEHDVYEDGECISEEWAELETCFMCGQVVRLEKLTKEDPFELEEDPIIIHPVIDPEKWNYRPDKRERKKEKLPKKLRNGWS